MERVYSDSNAYETASIADNLLYLFTSAEAPTIDYLKELLETITDEQKKLTESIGIENHDVDVFNLRAGDDLFDKEFRCFKVFVNANRICGETEIEEAAEIVLRKIELHDAFLFRYAYEREIVAFQSLKNDLHEVDTFTALNKLWGAPESFFRLEQKAQNVLNLYRKKEDTRAEKEKKTHSTEQRKIVRNLLNSELIAFVEVYSKMEPDVFGDIAKKMEQYVKTINAKIRARMNDNSSSKEQDEEKPVDDSE